MSERGDVSAGQFLGGVVVDEGHYVFAREQRADVAGQHRAPAAEVRGAVLALMAPESADRRLLVLMDDNQRPAASDAPVYPDGLETIDQPGKAVLHECVRCPQSVRDLAVANYKQFHDHDGWFHPMCKDRLRVSTGMPVTVYG